MSEGNHTIGERRERIKGMERQTIKADKRNVVGKKVKRLRWEGKIPAVIYGRNMDPLPITLDAHDATLTLRRASSSSIFNLDVEGKEHAVLVREIQRDFIKGDYLHVDFQVVSLTEKLRTDVAIELVGEAPVVEDFNALVVSGITEVEVECLPQDLPERIIVDVSGLAEIGNAIYLKDIPAPENVEFLTDLEELVAVASSIKEEVVEEEEVEEELLEEEILEGPEIIERGKQEEEEISEEEE